MQIPIEQIIEFQKKRNACHVRSVNYFAEILGYHFPEHDNDKNSGPVQIGYAYSDWCEYHNAKMLPVQHEAYIHARDEHHKNNAHHFQHYQDVSQIQPITLIEMVCDWAAKNFESYYILKHEHFYNVEQWFETVNNIGWTKQQIDFIYDKVAAVQQHADNTELLKIWDSIISLR